MLVALLETSDPMSPGSMRRYADLAEHALASMPDIRVERIDLAPPVLSRKLPSVLKTFWHHASVARNARRLRRRVDIDVFHVIDGSHGYVATYLPPGRSVVTVHDVIPWLQCEGCFPVAPPSRAARWIISRAIHGLGDATHLVCDSTATQTDLHRAAESVAGCTRVVFPPLDPSFFDAINVPPNGTFGTPFIFHLGNNAFYKNRSGVVEIFSRIARSVPHRLIMAGPAPTAEMKKALQNSGIEDRVEFVVNPSDDQVRMFYRTANLFLFPSRYEGFGWPPLEAMASGCPVVCSDAGSLGEVVGNAALTGPADDIEKLGKYCIDMLAAPSIAQLYRQRGLLRAAEFGLGPFGRALSDVYRQVCFHDSVRTETISC